MKIFGFTLTRDSLLLWLGILGAAVLYLGNMPAPTQWTWAQWMQTIAAIIGVICGKLATSPLLGKEDVGGAGVGNVKLPVIVLAVALGLGMLTLPSCAKAPPNLSPQAQTAYTADQISQAISHLRDTAIQAEATGGLSTATARIVVKLDRDAQKVLKAMPAGWQQTVAALWTTAKKEIPAKTLADPLIASAVSAVDIALAAWLPQGGVS